MSWTEIKLDLFKDCQNAMTYQDFIYTEAMNSADSMTSLEACMPRIDSHLLSKGLFEVSDVINSGAVIPNKDATIDQIRQICGKLFDLQFTRLQGYSILQTTLVSIYMNNGFTIENDLLKHVVDSFAIATLAIEAFATKTIQNSNSYWTATNKYETKMRKANKDESLQFLQQYKKDHPENSDVVDCALFEIEFADYLDQYPKKSLPDFPEYVKESSDIGLFPQIHYRDLSIHSPPCRVDIVPHEEAITKFKEFLVGIKEVEQVEERTTFEEIIDLGFNWRRNHQDCISFLVFLFIRKIVQTDEDTVFGKYNIKTFIINDIKRYHPPQTMSTHHDFPTIARNLLVFLDSALRCVCGPMSYDHAFLSKYLFGLWVTIEKHLVSLEQYQASSWNYITSGIKEYDSVIKSVMILWTTKISIKLTEYMVYLGFQVDVYNNDDHCTMALILQTMAKDAAIIYERETILRAMYSAAEHRKGKNKRMEVQKFIRIMPEINISRARAAYFEACFHALRWAYKKNLLLNTNKGQFFNPGKTYQARVSPANQSFAIEFPSIEDYMKMYDFENVPEADLTKLALDKFNEAKKMISEVIQLYGKTPERMAILKDIISSSSVLYGYKDGMSVSVKYPDVGTMSVSLQHQ